MKENNGDYAEITYHCYDDRILIINNRMTPEQIREVQEAFWASYDIHRRTETEVRKQNYKDSTPVAEVSERRRKFKKKERSGAGIR